MRREEVLLHPWHWRLLTMPLGTYTCEDRADRIHPVLVGDPGLWADVLSEIAAEHAAAAVEYAATAVARQQAHEEALSKGWRPFFAFPPMEPLPPLAAEPEFDESWVYEYVCEVCGVSHLGGKYYRHWRFNHRVCSNHCESERRKALKRQWQRDNPPLPGQAHAARTAQRAAARAGRQCAHCGVVIEAARSTRRFCSDICRVKAHREATRMQAEG